MSLGVFVVAGFAKHVCLFDQYIDSTAPHKVMHMAGNGQNLHLLASWIVYCVSNVIRTDQVSLSASSACVLGVSGSYVRAGARTCSQLLRA